MADVSIAAFVRGQGSVKKGMEYLAKPVLECGKGLPLWYFPFGIPRKSKNKIPKRQSLAALQMRFGGSSGRACPTGLLSQKPPVAVKHSRAGRSGARASLLM
jgi:hypothetical protein